MIIKGVRSKIGVKSRKPLVGCSYMHTNKTKFSFLSRDISQNTLLRVMQEEQHGFRAHGVQTTDWHIHGV